LRWQPISVRRTMSNRLVIGNVTLEKDGDVISIVPETTPDKEEYQYDVTESVYPTPDLRARVEQIVDLAVYEAANDRVDDVVEKSYVDAILDLIREEKEAMIQRLRMPEIDDEMFDQAVLTFNMQLDEEQKRL
jgi:hypothetical protein